MSRPGLMLTLFVVAMWAWPIGAIQRAMSRRRSAPKMHKPAYGPGSSYRPGSGDGTHD